jgi:hypothetical protein
MIPETNCPRGQLRVMSPLVCLALAMLLLPACSRRDAKTAAPPSDSTLVSAPSGNASDATSAASFQPSGPQVGKTDSLMNAIAPKLETWAALWRDVLPGFEVDSMWNVGATRWKPDFSEPGTDLFVDNGPESRLLLMPSDDGRYLLNVDWYLSFVPGGDGLVQDQGEVDSQPRLVDLRLKRQMIVETCGTPCGFHWGGWVGPDAFAIGEWMTLDNEWAQGSLTIYSLRDSSAVTYVTRVVSSSASYQPYNSAWMHWLTGLYQQMKSRPKT